MIKFEVKGNLDMIPCCPADPPVLILEKRRELHSKRRCEGVAVEYFGLSPRITKF